MRHAHKKKPALKQTKMTCRYTLNWWVGIKDLEIYKSKIKISIKLTIQNHWFTIFPFVCENIEIILANQIILQRI